MRIFLVVLVIIFMWGATYAESYVSIGVGTGSLRTNNYMPTVSETNMHLYGAFRYQREIVTGFRIGIDIGYYDFSETRKLILSEEVVDLSIKRQVISVPVEASYKFGYISMYAGYGLLLNVRSSYTFSENDTFMNVNDSDLDSHFITGTRVQIIRRMSADFSVVFPNGSFAHTYDHFMTLSLGYALHL